jgi:hypothetical protein
MMHGQKTSKQFYVQKISPPENRAVCEKTWKNIAQSDKPQMTIWRMRFACRIHKATNTLPECVMIIIF